MIVENGPGVLESAQNQMPGAGFGDDDDIFGGDVSSIMIRPDQILNDLNIAHE